MYQSITKVDNSTAEEKLQIHAREERDIGYKSSYIRRSRWIGYLRRGRPEREDNGKNCHLDLIHPKSSGEDFR